jgi:hypothetical protein
VVMYIYPILLKSYTGLSAGCVLFCNELAVSEFRMLPHEVAGSLLHSCKFCSTVVKNKLSVSVFLKLPHCNNGIWRVFVGFLFNFAFFKKYDITCY